MGDMKVFGYAQGSKVTPSMVTADSNFLPLGFRMVWKGEEYLWAYNAGGADITTKDGTSVITGASGYSICNTSVSDAANAFAGVCKHNTITAAMYGFIMTRGFTEVRTGNSVITGDYVPVGLSVLGGFGLAAMGTAGTNVVNAIAFNVDTVSVSTFYAFVRSHM